MEKYPTFENKLQNQKKEGIQDMQFSNILSNQFCWAVIGVPGSGKTTFIQQILNHDSMYAGKFDYILISSPSPFHIQGVDSECISTQFKIDWIYERINFLQQQGMRNKNILIILDDCISSVKQNQNDKMLQDLIFNRRHIIEGCTISIIITTQQFTMIPAKFRGVCDHFTFLSMSPKDFEYLKKELVYSSNRKCLQQVLETFQVKHQFIYVRNQPFLLCQNFRPLIQGCDYVAISNEFQPVSKEKPLLEEQQQQQNPQLSKLANQDSPIPFISLKNEGNSKKCLFSFYKK